MLLLRPSGFPSRQHGFGLVEILIGLVIGLLATLVIMQVFSTFEGQKRSTTGSADAQTNGGIALYNLARDLQMAGYGILPVNNSAINCTTPQIFPSAAATVSSLSPVTITDGGTAGASDTITIRYGTSAIAGTPMPITLMTGSVASVENNLGCEAGIGVVLTGANTCNVTAINGVTGTTSITLADAGSAMANNNLSCLGQWNEIRYAVNANNLERRGDPIVTDIVNIQAQYGVSAAANTNEVVQWVDATGTWAAASITTANRNRIKAVRVAIVARNGLQEKTNVSKTCHSTTANAAPVCSWPDRPANALVAGSLASPAPAIDLSNIANWQQYRYRVFDTIIPLRNVIWSKDKIL